MFLYNYSLRILEVEQLHLSLKLSLFSLYILFYFFSEFLLSVSLLHFYYCLILFFLLCLLLLLFTLLSIIVTTYFLIIIVQVKHQGNESLVFESFKIVDITSRY